MKINRLGFCLEYTLNMRKILLFLFILISALLIAWFSFTHTATAPLENEETSRIENVNIENTYSYKDILRLDTTFTDKDISSPLTIRGEARGTWFFEASFPVILTNWDGLIIAEGIATAQSDWMTEEYVPFEVTLVFDAPYKNGDQDFMSRGSLILKKDNPSGLPENDDAYEITVYFSQQ